MKQIFKVLQWGHNTNEIDKLTSLSMEIILELENFVNLKRLLESTDTTHNCLERRAVA